MKISWRTQTKQIVQLFKIALHNAGTPASSVTPTGGAQSDFESKNVPAHPTIFSVAHVSANHTREVYAKSSHHQRKSLAEMRKSSEIFHQIQDNLHNGQKTVLLYYLAATIQYYIRLAISKQGNMKDLAKEFHVKLMVLKRCINGRKYKGGS